MSLSIEPGRGRRGRGLCAGLNLVPYIDLLTCMVAFLLITAAWTQLARLEVRQRQAGQPDEQEASPQRRLVVVVGAEGFNLVFGAEREALPRAPEGHDYVRLAVALERVRRAEPDRLDAEVASEDRIPFDTIVRTMDVLLAAGFSGLSLSAGEVSSERL